MTGKAEKPSDEGTPTGAPSRAQAGKQEEKKAAAKKTEVNLQKKTEQAKPGKKVEKLRCSTCGISVESEKVWVQFKCPACGKESITRCEKCKRLENSYTCQGCGFVGP
jgi:predicted RNA-binding Zn-ribbon protein involved in translation (DUF1610 family)